MRIAVILIIAILSGCSANRMPSEASTALRNAPTLELFSLDPSFMANTDDVSAFHGWKVLGSTEFAIGNSRQSLLDALDAGIAEHDGRIAKCFDPRHGIRVTHQGKQFDFLICFRCFQARWYIDDVENQGFLLSRSPQATFDKLLSDASVTLPPPAE